MSDELKSIQNYIHTIERKLATGDATEHTHRSSLEALVQSWASGITATNEPKHIECGAPDFILRKVRELSDKATTEVTKVSFVQ